MLKVGCFPRPVFVVAALVLVVAIEFAGGGAEKLVAGRAQPHISIKPPSDLPLRIHGISVVGVVEVYQHASSP
jgi:hypothetical protein